MLRSGRYLSYIFCSLSYSFWVDMDIIVPVSIFVDHRIWVGPK